MSEAPRYTIKAIRAYERPVRMRLPFRFGDTVVSETAEAFVVVVVDGDHGMSQGYAAQLMVPRWFDKRPELSNEDTVEELRSAVSLAAKQGFGLSGTLQGIAADLRAAVHEGMPEGTPKLASGFGPAVCEMALIDALCRDLNVGFPAAARADLFGLVAACPADLSAEHLRAHLAGLAPRWDIAIRHTVGYDAPLTEADVESRPPDSQPVALSDVIAATGIRHFKLKLKGDPDADIARLSAISEVLADLPDYAATLDANEQYDGARFAEFQTRFSAEPGLAGIRAATLFVEQPFPRDIALDEIGDGFQYTIPLVLDEGDDADDAFVRAAEAGWAGVSVKSCKGVLRALLNSARVASLREHGQPALLSAEDLTCQPGLCWQQDTLMSATVGASHIERNGHHFAGGMQGASEKEVMAALAAHPDLYILSADGRPNLRIEKGRVALSSLNATGFASNPPPVLSENTIIAAEE